MHLIGVVGRPLGDRHRLGHDDHRTVAAAVEVTVELLGAGLVIAVDRPVDHRNLGVVLAQRVGQSGREALRTVTGGDHQHGRAVEVLRLVERLVPPLDAEQALIEYPIAPRGRRRGPEPGTAQRHLDGSVLVEQLDVGLDLAGRVDVDHAGVAVVRVASRAVGANFANAQRDRQEALADGLHAGVGVNGLEARIEQSRVHHVGALLRADRAGQPDLGEHRIRAVGGVHRRQAGERGAVLDATVGEGHSHLVAFHPVRVGREQFGDVVGGRRVVLVGGPQHRSGPPNVLAVLVGVDAELDHSRGGHLRRCRHRSLGVEQQHLVEGHVADL